MKKSLTALAMAAAFATSTAWAATTTNKGMTDYADWEQMAFSDACMNGEVSATGLYTTQADEDQSKNIL